MGKVVCAALQLFGQPRAAQRGSSPARKAREGQKPLSSAYGQRIEGWRLPFFAIEAPVSGLGV